ncbi:GNAT family N-acetyltransferase [Caldibacillus lycopersici]|uniref:GNAT family N-acetyltransferase n=1 Tax=Perspicuibacillus lycopersici TaxID=1325689 RepID=A0AAE3ISB3_9BACI|nr:GNAT family N-acetyltransferase [Perspicuibacillus lycopersici]MCU9613507.1 GNAT family N-acetyltransferase [Perspicuibacillus lycopersici]
MNLFNIIKNKKQYWLVDQVKQEVDDMEYQQQFEQLLAAWNEERVGYLSLLMDEAYEAWLLNKGFQKVSSIVEYTRELIEIPNAKETILPHCLAEGLIKDEDYGALYERCRSGSANKNVQQPIETVMNSLQSELGPNWQNHCYYFSQGGTIVGISIPHIEMGTTDEGRLFYFGVVPEMRGKGIGTMIHRITLSLLLQFQAKYYVGSTDVHNHHMIKIFEQNGCKLRDRKGIYKIVLTS